jgi:hypothetical protein
METSAVAPREAEVPMVEQEVVRQMRVLEEAGWGAKRIARELGIARNTVRRYLRREASTTGPQQRRWRSSRVRPKATPLPGDGGSAEAPVPARPASTGARALLKAAADDELRCIALFAAGRRGQSSRGAG